MIEVPPCRPFPLPQVVTIGSNWAALPEPCRSLDSETSSGHVRSNIVEVRGSTAESTLFCRWFVPLYKGVMSQIKSSPLDAVRSTQFHQHLLPQQFSNQVGKAEGKVNSSVSQNRPGDAHRAMHTPMSWYQVVPSSCSCICFTFSHPLAFCLHQLHSCALGHSSLFTLAQVLENRQLGMSRRLCDGLPRLAEHFV